MYNKQQYILVLLLIGFWISGCASTGPTLRPQIVFDSLSEAHPSGIPVDAALSEMQNAGFECEFIRNGTFKHEADEPDSITKKLTTYDNIDFLRCRRNTQEGLVSYFDNVALVIENGKVIKILANWGATGP